jgi:hypothetical protein
MSSEQHNPHGEAFVTMMGADIFLVVKPPLEEEEKPGFPVPPYMNRLNLHDPELPNGSQIISLIDYKSSGHWTKNLEVFMENVTKHLGNYAVDRQLYHVHPETIFDTSEQTVEVQAQYL